MVDRLQHHARANRNSPTEPEVRLWRHLSNSQLGGFKFRRQHRIGRRILDFFCPSIASGVEIDGHTHDLDLDRAADEVLAREGAVVVRFSNADVMQNMEGVLISILQAANRRPPRWPSTSATPHPDPASGRFSPRENLNNAGRCSPDAPEGERL